MYVCMYVDIKRQKLTFCRRMNSKKLFYLSNWDIYHELFEQLNSYFRLLMFSSSFHLIHSSAFFECTICSVSFI